MLDFYKLAGQFVVLNNAAQNSLSIVKSTKKVKVLLVRTSHWDEIGIKVSAYQYIVKTVQS